MGSFSGNAQLNKPIIEIPGNSTYPTLEDFQFQFPDLYQYLDSRYIQNEKGKIVSTLKEFNHLTNFTIPLIKKGKVIGRLFYSNGNTSYLDFSNYKKEVKINLITKTTSQSKNSIESIIVPTVLIKNKYRSVNANQRSWCAVSCTIGAIAIAASDGPSPLMDVLAVSYQLSCLAGCNN